MAKKPTKTTGSKADQSDYIRLIKESVEKDIARLEKKMDDDISSVKKSMSEGDKQLDDKIDTVESKIEARLDGVDEALRGNGRIGLFEQMRNTKWKFKAIVICLILLFGFKFFGRSLDDMYKSMFSNGSTPIKKVEPSAQDGEGKETENGATVIEEPEKPEENPRVEKLSEIPTTGPAS